MYFEVHIMSIYAITMNMMRQWFEMLSLLRLKDKSNEHMFVKCKSIVTIMWNIMQELNFTSTNHLPHVDGHINRISLYVVKVVYKGYHYVNLWSMSLRVAYIWDALFHD
jgi:hypothetical protein